MPATTIMMTTQMRKNREQKEQGNFSFGKPKQAPTPPPEKPKRECKNPVLRVMNDGLELLNLTSTQTVTYFGMTVTMLLLISAMRSPEEFFFDKHVMDRIVDNTFDSAHNKFTQVRRIADVFEWGNKVLLPGLFADAGPCGTGEAIGSLTSQKACLDEVWPDGDGTFHMTGATTLSIADLVERMDQFDWTDGLTVRQVRAQPVSCPDTDQLGACLPEVSDGHVISTATYGHNMGSKPFVYHAAEDIGASPTGIVSASIPSLRGYEGGGFFGFVIPFFSDVYLPSQEGTFDQIIDYRQSRVSTTNGKEAKFHCVRTSLNGVHIKQRCDPGANGDGTGELTSAVRNHVEEFWNDLKRGHWIDTRTRMVVMVLQLRSNHLGIRYRISLMFEFTSLGTVLPSYDVETRVLSRTAQRNMRTYAYICLGMVIFFIVLEGVELTNSSIGEYFADVWNVMDWSNFVVYFLVFMQLLAVDEAQLNPDCSSYMCRDAGYFDDYKVMSEYRTMKLYFSLCVCIQLLKILKFASALVPKMGLATDVLRECAIDLVFFGVTFIISMAAFAMMLYVQLGPVMEGYVTQTAAFISLFRALFGDFDIDEIMDNSSGYLNALLFLAYLYVAMFILLSMFLAILAEAQVKVRVREEEKMLDPEFRNYGVLSHALDGLKSIRSCIQQSCSSANEVDEDGVDLQDPVKLPGHDESDVPSQVMPTNAEQAMLLMVREMRNLQAQVALLQAQVATGGDLRPRSGSPGSRSSSRPGSPALAGKSSSFRRPEPKRLIPVWNFLGGPAPSDGLGADRANGKYDA